MVGAAALKLLLADERVTKVVAPTRRPLLPHAKLVNPIANSADLLRIPVIAMVVSGRWRWPLPVIARMRDVAVLPWRA